VKYRRKRKPRTMPENPVERQQLANELARTCREIVFSSTFFWSDMRWEMDKEWLDLLREARCADDLPVSQPSMLSPASYLYGIPIYITPGVFPHLIVRQP
jgi:hypothetical protein